MLSPVLHKVSTAVTVVIAPDYFYDSVMGSSGSSTSTMTATPTGGTAPYTYAWSINSYSGAGIPAVASPTTAATGFTYSGLDTIGDFSEAIVQCTVTDVFGSSGHFIASFSITRVGF